MDDGGSYQYYKRKPQPDYSEERYEINIPTKPAAPEKENSSGGGGGYTGGGSGSKLSGVDRDVYDRLESSFSPGKDTQKWEQEKNDNYDIYKDWASRKDIISDETWDAINKKWETPEA